ncbi:MAG: hypothetical protein JRM99_05650 [Nitrososphaerota archaeon]|nr:hypothetical protein [Nitrososphaerota archaeon]
MKHSTGDREHCDGQVQLRPRAEREELLGVGEGAFKFAGMPYDEALGRCYEGARYYDPETGRFVAEDSYAGNESDPITLNRYVCARDNPMKIVDMNGHERWDPTPRKPSSRTTKDMVSGTRGREPSWEELTGRTAWRRFASTEPGLVKLIYPGWLYTAESKCQRQDSRS